ncbi:MAG: cytochrome c-type biogenesis protein CcmH [Bradymonadaceae bacterium]
MADSPLQTYAAALIAAVVSLWAIPISAGDTGPTADAAGAAPTAGRAERTPGEVSNVVQDLSRQIFSPFCPGKTIAMCPSSGAAEVRRKIQQMAREGKSRRAIKREIIERYGEKYRIEEPPPTDHIPLVVLIVAGLLICAGAIAYFSRGSDDTEGDTGGPPQDLDPEERALLDEMREEYEEPR